LIAAFVFILDLSREAARWNIESGEVVVTIESLILRQRDTSGSQVRNIHTEHRARADTKVATNSERCDLQASVEGLSARRSGAEVIVSIEESQVIRGDVIDGGIPAVMLENLKTPLTSSIQ
jgi:hypothetical protein